MIMKLSSVNDTTFVPSPNDTYLQILKQSTQGTKCMQLATLITSFLLAVCLGNASVHFSDLYLIASFVSDYLHIFDAIGT
jgi:hypothetical protein